MWLTDPANGYVTGTVVRVVGGQRPMLADPFGFAIRNTSM